MHLTITILMFVLLGLCAVVSVFEEICPNKVPKYVKPVLFASTLMLLIPVLDFLFSLVDIDFIFEFLGS